MLGRHRRSDGVRGDGLELDVKSSVAEGVGNYPQGHFAAAMRRQTAPISQLKSRLIVFCMERLLIGLRNVVDRS